MLSSRDTPFSEDGWALIIEDIRRLALLVGGGSNDMNAGAIDADQQAINDLSTALNSHEIDPDAHATLLASYLLRTDYTAPFTILSTVNTVGGSQALGATTTTTITGYTTTGTDTLTGFNTGTGILTVPTTGLYLVTGYVWPTWSGAGTGSWGIEVQVNGVAKTEFGRPRVYPYNAAGGDPAASLAGTRWLTAADTVKLVFNNSSTAATVLEAAITISRLT